MKALILNSGLGNRMGTFTKDHPKCMTKIDSFDSILSRQLKLLSSLGIQDIIITTGHCHRILVEYCHSLNLALHYKFIYNEQYKNTNYIYSIYCAKEYLKNDNILLIHGDLIFNETVLKTIIKNPNSCMTISSTQPLKEKDFKAIIIDGLVKKIGVNFFKNTVMAQPLYKLNKKDWHMWLQSIITFCESGNVTCYAEDAFNTISDSCQIYASDIKEQLCFEIDTPEDLVTITRRFKYEK